MTKKGRKVFQIPMFGVTGNKVMNIPRVRRHAHIWRETNGSIRCIECGESTMSGVYVTPKYRKFRL